MRETEHFVNDGYGWECRRCRAADAEAAASDDGACAGDDQFRAAVLPRFFREGEAEERETSFSIRALARRRDTLQGRALVCPRCDAAEELSDA